MNSDLNNWMTASNWLFDRTDKWRSSCNYAETENHCVERLTHWVGVRDSSASGPKYLTRIVVVRFSGPFSSVRSPVHLKIMKFHPSVACSVHNIAVGVRRPKSKAMIVKLLERFDLYKLSW